MRIVIASGKGGAGKTTVTACLAAQWMGDLMLADADVEAPNLHLLLHPNLAEPETVCLDVPELLADKIITDLQKVHIDEDDVADDAGSLAASAEALRLTAAAPPRNQNLGPDYE